MFDEFYVGEMRQLLLEMRESHVLLQLKSKMKTERVSLAPILADENPFGHEAVALRPQTARPSLANPVMYEPDMHNF